MPAIFNINQRKLIFSNLLHVFFISSFSVLILLSVCAQGQSVSKKAETSFMAGVGLSYGTLRMRDVSFSKLPLSANLLIPTLFVEWIHEKKLLQLRGNFFRRNLMPGSVSAYSGRLQSLFLAADFYWVLGKIDDHARLQFSVGPSLLTQFVVRQYPGTINNSGRRERFFSLGPSAVVCWKISDLISIKNCTELPLVAVFIANPPIPESSYVIQTEISGAGSGQTVLAFPERALLFWNATEVSLSRSGKAFSIALRHQYSFYRLGHPTTISQGTGEYGLRLNYSF